MLLQIAEPEITGIPNMHKQCAIGIDLGTTNSLVATMQNNTPTILKDYGQQTLIPSIVHYGKNTINIGNDALSWRLLDPQNTIISVKRFMGRKLSDLHETYPYKFVQEQQDILHIETAHGIKNPIQISSDILAYLKQIAIANLDTTPIGAVITVPAYFNDSQRQATKMAATLAGLNVLRLLNEPTAAAIAYGLNNKQNGTFLVYDLGGGTFDISILHLHNDIFEVLAVNGDTHLGGDDFDQIVYEYIIQTIKITPQNNQDQAQIKITARNIKEQLSTQDNITTTINIDNQPYPITMSCHEFIQRSQFLIDKTLKLVKQTLRDLKLQPQQLNDIILVGGATRMPHLQKTLTDFFARPVLNTINPDEVVAIGAAIQADLLVGNQKSDWLLLDVIPLSLGIETMGGIVEKIIPRNSTLPISKAQEFTTHVDSQTAMSIHVVQGERELIHDCRSLARFSLKSLPPMPAGTLKIKITFQVDADGLLSVTATETKTGNTQSIEVKPSFGLDTNQIEQMLTQSINAASEDMAQRLLIEHKIAATTLIHLTQKAIQNHHNLISKTKHQQITHTINDLQQLLAQDIEVKLKTTQLTSLMDQLNSLTTDLADKIMNQTIKQGLTGTAIKQVEI